MSRQWCFAQGLQKRGQRIRCPVDLQSSIITECGKLKRGLQARVLFDKLLFNDLKITFQPQPEGLPATTYAQPASLRTEEVGPRFEKAVQQTAADVRGEALLAFVDLEGMAWKLIGGGKLCPPGTYLPEAVKTVVGLAVADFCRKLDAEEVPQVVLADREQLDRVLFGYLRTAAKNHFRAECRQLARNQPSSHAGILSDLQQEPAEVLNRHQVAADLLDILLAKCDQLEKEIVRLRLDGAQLNEIADLLNIPATTLYKRWERLLARLRDSSLDLVEQLPS